MAILIELLKSPSVATGAVEVVERKGLGHPDTICDHLSEELSRALSRHYLEQFGVVLHHNVDKSLLVAGRSQPAFAGGGILEPMDIYLSGRAAGEHRGKQVPVGALANECVQSWFQRNLHAVTPATDVRLHCLVRPGSSDLVDLFRRQRKQHIVLANDTSCGAGFAPLSPLERVVLEVERSLNRPNFKAAHPESGEDIKVMGVRRDDRISLTISCAFIGRHLRDIRAYADARDRLAAASRDAAQKSTAMEIDIRVNAADELPQAIYLTVTGTSAEAGDDGQTGRGNRANGLITPFRPMTLEALAGKNPITHVGKLYNVAASRLAAAVVAEVPEIIEAECHLVSEIGAPIDDPKLALMRVRSADQGLARDTERIIRSVAEREIRGIGKLWEQFVAGEIAVA